MGKNTFIRTFARAVQKVFTIGEFLVSIHLSHRLSNDLAYKLKSTLSHRLSHGPVFVSFLCCKRPAGAPAARSLVLINWFI